MDVQDKTIWQVGTGDSEHSHEKIFLEFDVMAIGPGYSGPYDKKLYSKIRAVSVFCEEPKEGDLVLLRSGTAKIVSVGIIADDKLHHNEEFGDVDGWSLEHVRRVRWIPNTGKEFPVRTLGGQVSRFSRVNVPSVINWIKRLNVSRKQMRRSLSLLPKKSKTISVEEMGKKLFLEGLPSEYIDNLVSRLESIQRVASWYETEDKKPEGRPSESETVTYLVMPFLSALGWSHQTAAIEWRNVDIALFERMPSNDKTLSCVVEVKVPESSTFSHLGQAKEYAMGKGRNHCKRLIVTDGIRYAYYRKQENNFKLSAYLNLQRMRECYYLYRCKGAVEAIMGMARLGANY